MGSDINAIADILISQEENFIIKSALEIALVEVEETDENTYSPNEG